LKLAVQRSQSSGYFCREIANFLIGIATIYEQYGVNLVKIAQQIRPGRLPFDEKALVLQEDFATLYDDIKAFGDGFRTLAQYFRSSIATSVRTTLTETSKTVEAANDRYQRVRQDCFQSRQWAKALFSKYQKALDAAEYEIQTWLKECDGGASSAMESSEHSIEMPLSDVAWEKSLYRLGSKNYEGTLRLIQKLKEVENCEREYAEAVNKENQKVDLSQEMETVALEKLQETEQDRLLLFALTVVDKVFHGEIDMEGLKLNTPANLNTEASFAEGFEKKGKDLLAGLNAGLFKQQSIPYEPGMGRMEAETLGLPTEVGEIRDRVKATFSKHEVRIKATEAIFKLLEEIGELTSQSSSEVTIRTQAQIGNQANSSSSANVVGTRTGQLWLATVNTFQYEAKLFADVAFTCKKLKSQKVEGWMTHASKNQKNEMELDDSAWKLVCDSARTETKSESRYKYSKGQADKVRSRASSRGDLSSGSNDSSDGPTTPKLDNPSLAAPNSPFRLFKGGGVMKKALGQISEDEKEEKDKLAFEEASTAKKKATMAYKTYTASRIEKFESQDKEGWEELKNTIKSMLQTAKLLQDARKETLNVKIAEETKNSFPLLPSDLDDWLETVKERIEQKEKTTLTDTSETEFALSATRPEHRNVEKLLAMTGTEDALPDLVIVVEEAASSFDRSIKLAGSFESVTSIKSEASPTNQEVAVSIIEKQERDGESNTNSRNDLNMKAFEKHFCSKMQEGEKLPEILEIFTCSYRPKEKSAFLTPNLHGRCFTTKDKLFFLAWDNKKFNLKWEDILSVEFEKGFMGSANDNAVAVTYQSEGSESTFTLNKLESGDKILSHLQDLLNAKTKTERSIISCGDGSGNESSPVPSDELLKEMEVVVSKLLKNVSIKSVFENVWEDPVGKKSFYEAWLEEEECFDITMEDWEVAKPDAPFRNPWCSTKGETYTHKRLVTFKFKRTTHLYIGPPIAFVKQMHYLRVEGNDKIALAIEATFEGIPYSDTFGVEMRWIARRQGSNDVKVDVGLFVLFKKSTMLKSQIKSGTISETKNVHLRLFNAVKKACSRAGLSPEGDLEEEETEEVVEVETKKPEGGILATLQDAGLKSPLGAVGLVAAFVVGRYVLSYFFGSSGQADIARLEMQIGEMQEDIRALQKSVDMMLEILRESRRE
jgi:VAD1 Analog of StAR-related lipid transfer domain